MKRTIRAILAAIMVVSIVRPGECAPVGGTVDPPVRVRFELRDEVVVRGDLTAWDEEGIDGTFGPRSWWELKTDDLWRIGIRVIDQDQPDHWLVLGRACLRTDDGEARAESAFRRALRLDPEITDRIDAIRAEIAEEEQTERDQQRRIDGAKLETASPESRDWPTAPWPALTVDERRTAALTVKAESEALLERFGHHWTPIQSGSFLIYTDVPRDVAAPWVRTIERALVRAHVTLGIPHSVDLFWGPCVIFVFTSRDDFEIVEADAFNQLLPGGQFAICHPVGPKVTVVAHHDGDAAMTQWRIAREICHAVMHRHHAPRRPPGWLNEGIALHVADQAIELPPHLNRHRDVALAYIREGGSVNDLFHLDYEHPRWPGPANVGPAVGALVVERIAAENPRGLASLIGRIKRRQEPWSELVPSSLGTTREQIATYIEAYYRVND
ncbi:MAG: hypothetical protein AAF432_03015 [Planctomycetota bacterium]